MESGSAAQFCWLPRRSQSERRFGVRTEWGLFRHYAVWWQQHILLSGVWHDLYDHAVSDRGERMPKRTGESQKQRSMVRLPETVESAVAAYAAVASAAGISLLAIVSPAEASVVYTPADI